MQLSGSRTAAALREAFTPEADAAARMLDFARRADVEGLADAESRHAGRLGRLGS